MALATVSTSQILKVDTSHGLVFGFAIVSKLRNDAGELEDYYDLNVDVAGPHAGKRVPEHITEDAMFKCAVDAASSGVQMAGNDMHAGDDTGTYYFMFPLTEDIAKALEIETKRTGLLVAYKPEPEVLAKFKDGTYTGFSMEGARVTHEEHDDGN